MVWSFVVLAVLAWYLRPYAAPDGAPVAPVRGHAAGPVPVTVLEANIEYGQAAPALVDVIRRERPDLVFVEECEARCARHLARDVPRTAYPYRDVVARDGGSGSAILSAFPLDTPGRITSPLAMPHATARIDGLPVRLQLAHPLPPDPGQVGAWRRDLGRLRAYVSDARRVGGQTIVAGDFNATRDHALFRDLLSAGELRDAAVHGGAAHTPSWPSQVPRPLGTQIDHVLISGGFGVRDARFVDLADSDHRALLVHLTLGTAQN
jgi:endonuclease/exonuclease/phosphatase (EEP) superfamily protein YafD